MDIHLEMQLEMCQEHLKDRNRLVSLLLRGDGCKHVAVNKTGKKVQELKVRTDSQGERSVNRPFLGGF